MFFTSNRLDRNGHPDLVANPAYLFPLPPHMRLSMIVRNLEAISISRAALTGSWPQVSA